MSKTKLKAIKTVEDYKELAILEDMERCGFNKLEALEMQGKINEYLDYSCNRPTNIAFYKMIKKAATGQNRHMESVLQKMIDLFNSEGISHEYFFENIDKYLPVVSLKTKGNKI